jgi:hypothetical protein
MVAFLMATLGPAWPVILPFLLLAFGGSVTGIWVIVNRRGSDKAKANTPLPPTWPEMWARIDQLETRVSTLEDEKEILHRTSTAMLAHIKVLEEIVPNPPGVPSRPDWGQELANINS